ncbi:unnamed protein product [Leuciscus chuanchicus]
MEMLRMATDEFDFLLWKVEHLIKKQDTKMRLAIPPSETFKSLRFQYRVGTSTISQIVVETCAALYQVMKEDFLKTPSTEAEWRSIAQDFARKRQFPHCLGALDGKHIHVQPPTKSGSLYHKGRFSVLMMAAVDANYKLIYASVGTQEPDKVVKITMASLCIHNFLCEHRSEAYTPPAFADWEKADHNMVGGVWRNHGMGVFQPVEHRRARNATVTAKMQRNLLRDYFVSTAGSVSWQEQHI